MRGRGIIAVAVDNGYKRAASYVVVVRLTLCAETAPGVGRPGHGDDMVALFALAYRVVVHLCAHRVLVVQLARVVLETLFTQPCNQTHAMRLVVAG